MKWAVGVNEAKEERKGWKNEAVKTLKGLDVRKTNIFCCESVFVVPFVAFFLFLANKKPHFVLFLLKTLNILQL